MNSAANATKYRPAATNAWERMNNPTKCDCCGREDLLKTVKMTNGASSMWMGRGCAAKAMGVGLREYNKAAKAVQDEADKAERAERDAAWRASYERAQAWLDERVPQLRGERLLQIEALGGWSAAKALGFAP